LVLTGIAFWFAHSAFRNPLFVWAALTARPLWKDSGAETFEDKLQLVWQALEPSAVFKPGPTQTLAIIAAPAGRSARALLMVRL